LITWIAWGGANTEFDDNPTVGLAVPLPARAFANGTAATARATASFPPKNGGITHLQIRRHWHWRRPSRRRPRSPGRFANA